jgi:hypothetical protein
MTGGPLKSKQAYLLLFFSTKGNDISDIHFTVILNFNLTRILI